MIVVNKQTLSEHDVFQMYYKESVTQLEITKDIFITSEALRFIKEHSIELIYSDQQVSNKSNIGYVSEDGKTNYSYKSEMMTHLRSNILIPKSDERIRFRGKIDSFIANVIQVQVKEHSLGHKQIVTDLQEINDYARYLLKSEVMESEIEEKSLLGINSNELRMHSHQTQNFYKLDHLILSYEYGQTEADLNLLRTLIREVELCAVDAHECHQLKNGESLIKALNRLSSALYIMMLKNRSKEYQINRKW